MVDRLKGDALLRTGGRGTFSISHLSRIERGKWGDLKVEDLRALARVLDTNLAWIMDGDSPDLGKAVAVFGPNEELSKSFADIANFYRGADDLGRRRIKSEPSMR